MGHRRLLAGFAVALAAALPAAAAPSWQIDLAGTLRCPEEATSAGGDVVPLRGLSGVTWLGDRRWAAVMDNSDVLVVFTLELSPRGEPLKAEDFQAMRLSMRHDYEDLAVCPPAVTASILAAEAALPRATEPDDGPHLLVCEEDTPAIHLIRLADGRLRGELPLPDVLRRPRPNRGLEALAVDHERGHVWTANEEAVPADGPAAAPGAGTVVRLVRLPARAAAAPPLHLAYAVDPPHPCAHLVAGPVLSGVVALVPLPDGRLLVLERSGCPGLPPFENRLCLVDPATARDVAGRAGGLAAAPELQVAKDVLWRGGLGCNLEGLGLGPPLPDGSLPLVAIADSDGLDAPAVLAGFRLSCRDGD